MKRRLLWIVAVLAVAGCKTPAPSIDPFLGRQTVVPPRPGEAVASLPAGAYYPAGGAPVTARQAAPAPAPRFVPSTGGTTSTNVATRPAVPVTRPATTRTGATAAPPATLPTEPAAPPAASPKPLRSTSPDEAPPGAGSSGTSSALQPTAGGFQAQRGSQLRLTPQIARQATTLTLPPRRFTPDGAATDISQWRGAASGQVAPASHQVPADPGQAWSAVSHNVRASATGLAGGSRGQYGFEPDYSRLVGQLEFSPAAQRWKLRYIPLDGQTDQYGGSVVLLDTPLLDAYHAGDFVTIHGEVAGGGPDPKAFAPLYRVERIERGP